MGGEVQISKAARRLGVSVTLLRRLERERKIPPARRNFSGRVYSESDLALLKALGVGQRPRRLKRPEDLLGAKT